MVPERVLFESVSKSIPPARQFQSVAIDQQHVHNDDRHQVWPAGVRLQPVGESAR